MVKAKKFIYVKPFEGMPTLENVKIVEEDLPELKDGEFLAEAVYFSIDPYMRAASDRYKINQTLIGRQIAKITKSKNPNFPVGKHVSSTFGWRSHTISNGQKSPGSPSPPELVNEDPNVPMILYLGILGMTGLTAYFGLLDICKPKAGETVVVSGAGGAVGSQVGQIAKIKGCKVIGITGSDDKISWLKEIGFDAAINYKTAPDLAAALKEVAPGGVDCYFDNVGGEISSTVLYQMKQSGRVAVCGSISSYNDKTGEPTRARIVQGAMIHGELTMRGFRVYSFMDRWAEGIEANLRWFKEGKLKHKETVTEGFDRLMEALIGLLEGRNVGKAIVKV